MQADGCPDKTMECYYHTDYTLTEPHPQYQKTATSTDAIAKAIIEH